ncbi:MAG TPA: GvpL/GvpF family gas vesicle protein [Solirubrobacterales bacterium]|nr:GvpL/GvpF family gas vesicle protein [Solirubrobacterales bacterium]
MSEEATRELQAAVEALAAETAPALVADARSDAEARARSILSREITRALLSESEGVLVAPRQDLARRRPPPPATEEPARERPADSPPSLPEHSALGLYLYGIVRADVRITGQLPGVDVPHEVFLLEGNELAAIVSSVPLEEFGEEQLRENLNDVAWLEEKARAHEAVLEAMLVSTTVVPMRLCTIFHDEAHVREMMGREGAVLLEALERLEGKSEWGVKAFAEPGALERAAAERAGEQSRGEALSPGVAYMDRRRKEARAREEAEEIADGWAQQIHEQLARCASEALLNPLQRREVSGHEGDMLLNGVYLVEEEGVEQLRRVVAGLGEDYRGRGVSVQMTGPWPAYNFVKSSIESAR